MRVKVILVFFFVVLVAVPIISVGKPTQEMNILPLDPGWVHGPIWGRINGYEYHGFYNESLFFYARNVRYFGIGHAFDAGLYPRHWIFREVKAFYSYFEGIITDHVIFGKIYGLPNQ